MARPTKLDALVPGTTQTVQERIVQLVAQGVPVSHACAAAGVAERTYYQWMRKGRAGQGIYEQFMQAVHEAHARAVTQVVLTHRRAAIGQAVRSRTVRTTLTDEGAHVETVNEEFYPPHVGALQWWMERREPALFGQVVARDGDNDPDVDSGYTATDDPAAEYDALSRILDGLAAREATGPGAAPDSQDAGVQPT